MILMGENATIPQCIFVTNCAGCPYFYMDESNTVTLCRKTHFDQGGDLDYWKHIPNPLGKRPAWCSLEGLEANKKEIFLMGVKSGLIFAHKQNDSLDIVRIFTYAYCHIKDEMFEKILKEIEEYIEGVKT